MSNSFKIQQYGQRVFDNIRAGILDAGRVEGSEKVFINNDVVIDCLVSSLAMQAAASKFEHCTAEQMADDIRESFLNQLRACQKMYGEELTKNTVRRQ